MSSRLSAFCIRARAFALALTALLALSAAPSWSLEVIEVPLSFGPDASGQGLLAALAGVEPVDGAGQLVLELTVVVQGLPQGDGVLVELQVICSEAAEETVAFEALDLFPPQGEVAERRILFDLSAFAALDPPPCLLAETMLRLAPVGEVVSLVLPAGGGYAKLQVVHF